MSKRDCEADLLHKQIILAGFGKIVNFGTDQLFIHIISTPTLWYLQPKTTNFFLASPLSDLLPYFKSKPISGVMESVKNGHFNRFHTSHPLNSFDNYGDDFTA